MVAQEAPEAVHAPPSLQTHLLSFPKPPWRFVHALIMTRPNSGLLGENVDFERDFVRNRPRHPSIQVTHRTKAAPEVTNARQMKASPGDDDEDDTNRRKKGVIPSKGDPGSHPTEANERRPPKRHIGTKTPLELRPSTFPRVPRLTSQGRRSAPRRWISRRTRVTGSRRF